MFAIKGNEHNISNIMATNPPVRTTLPVPADPVNTVDSVLNPPPPPPDDAIKRRKERKANGTVVRKYRAKKKKCFEDLEN